MILHLIPTDEWLALAAADHYSPASLAVDGFVHCSGDDDLMLDVANEFYTGGGDVLVLSIDEHDLDSDVRWEAPSPVPADWSGSPLFPHVYGSINLDAVVGVRRLVRDATGRFTGYANA